MHVADGILPWQADLWHLLAGRQQHAHAYLLHGPAGIGKRALAEQLMTLLLCQRPSVQGACGSCKGCLLLAAHTHPDHYILEPEEVDKAIPVVIPPGQACCIRVVRAGEGSQFAKGIPPFVLIEQVDLLPIPNSQVEVAITVQMRSHHARPDWLRVPWVILRSITTNRIACSARLLVGSIQSWYVIN